DWANIPGPASPDVSPNHSFAIDLNLFGEVSLARLFGPTSAVAGRPVLHRWLLAESPPEIALLRDRQRAVAELANHSDWRERLGVDAASARGFSLDRIAAMFDHARTMTFRAPLLDDLRARMEPSDAGAFARLARIAYWGELRHSPMAYAVLQVLVLWDFHVVY